MYNNTVSQSQYSEKPSYEQREPSVKNDSMSDDGVDASRVRQSEVWREMIGTSNGRDKALKLIQYSLKSYLLLHRVLAGDLRSRPRVRTLRSWETALLSRITPAISGLSLARKCLLLFNWLEPFNVITRSDDDSVPYTVSSSIRPIKPSQQPILYPFLNAPPPLLLDLVNGIAEDISTSAKLGLIKGRLGRTAARLADWTWLGATLVALVELSMKRSVVRSSTQQLESRLYKESMQYAGPTPDDPSREADESNLKQLSEQMYWIRMTRAKLLMDLIFVSYSCFNFERGREVIQTIAGLVSACLSSNKLYDRHQQAVIKKMLS